MRQLQLTTALLFFTVLCMAQGRAIFVGLQPSLRTQDYYSQGIFDVNAAPVVAQITLNTELDLRLTSILEYRLPPPLERTNTGIEVALPIAVNAKIARDVHSEGLYIAPFYSYYANKQDQLNVHAMGVEPGYFWAFNNKWGLTTGFQFGGKHLRFADDANYWSPHLSLKLIFGYWFRRDSLLGI